jgi:hypothetical protein
MISWIIDKYYCTIMCLCRQNCVPARTGLYKEKTNGKTVKD